MKQGRAADLPAVRIEADNERAWCGEQRLRLTPRAFAVLRHLVEHAQRLVTKEEFFAVVWRDTIVSEAALASCIRDLRRALGDSSRTPRYIETAHRRGFRFIGPIAGAPVASAPRTPTAEIEPPQLPVTRPPALPPLVGRDFELGRLHARLASAETGQRQLVFVTGEPGIGKTALVETFLAQIAGKRGVRVGRGQCVEQYGAGEAYLPVLEALGRLGREAHGGALVQTFKQHAPTWLAQLPALLTDDELRAVQRRAEGATRDRMLRELVEALDVFASEAPLVLVLEDLQWSDSATIDLLAMLARRREASHLLVVGTYRPADVVAGAHLLRTAKHELQLHGHCDEVSLQFLDAAAVNQYLLQRFPGSHFPPELARVLRRHTDGNPLFLVTTVDDLVAQGELRTVDGQWKLVGRPDDIRLRAPETLWQLVEKQIDRLTSDERTMLTVASVAGVEFSVAVAAAAALEVDDGESLCETLARRGQFLRASGVAEWPDGTVAGRYAFIHGLYQSVLYAGVPIGERIGLHLRTGQRLERGYGAATGEIAGELAMHFERGRDVERALHYRRQAGENALRQHGYREAATHATRALELLATVPDVDERAEQELTLQVILGAALTATKGYAAPEVERTYARAHALCASVGDARQLCSVLLGLGRFYVVRGALPTARGVGHEMLALGEKTQDLALQLAACSVLGLVSFYSGEFAAALSHLERGMALYDRAEHTPLRSPAFRAGQDVGVTCTTHAALAQWALGYPARAAALVDEALSRAHALQHPLSLTYACHFGAQLHVCRRDRHAVETLEETGLALATEHGFGLFLAGVHRGWLLAQRGDAEAGLAQMRRGVEASHGRGADVRMTAFRAAIAEVLGTLGRPEEGLTTLADALAGAEVFGEHYWTAELHRLKGTLLLQSGGREDEADACFREALAIARRQGTKSLELRAATSLSRLWASQGKTREAHAVLSDVYGWFTEGFDEADLSEARALLAELAPALSRSPARASRADTPRPRRQR